MIANKLGVQMSDKEEYQTLRLSLERSIPISTQSVEGLAFLRGGLSSIHWSEFQPVVQAVINLICKQLKVTPEKVSVIEAVPYEAGLVEPEIHIQPLTPMSTEQIEELSFGIQALFKLFKNPAAEFEDDFVSPIFPAAAQHAREEADQVVSIAGGRRMPCALKLRGTGLNGTLRFDGQICKGEEKESESEPYPILGEPDGFNVTKHYMYFKVNKTEGQRGQGLEKIYFDENVWGSKIFNIDYSNICEIQITVVDKKKGRKEWLKLAGLDL